MMLICGSKKMNSVYYFFIIFALTELGKTTAVGVYCILCPNEPVTPYPNQRPTTDFPNLPITSDPVTEKSHANIARPVISTQCTCCENQQTIPCTVMPINVSCNFQCQPAHSCPCSKIQCILPSLCQGCGVNVTGSSSSNTSYMLSSTLRGSTPTGCRLIVACCGQQLEITHPSESTSTLSPMPETLINCPPGTQLVGKRCHLLYCSHGSKMINDRCTVIECPKGSIWTRNRCSALQPIVHNMTFHSTIATQFNKKISDIILNNTNIFIVNASVTIRDGIKYNDDCNNDIGDCETASAPNLKCCAVMTPRICEQQNNRWRCYSRRSRRCGNFCVAPIIYLKPTRMHATPQYLIIPPMQNYFKSYGNGSHLTGGYDCSGCAFNDMNRCSYYCYRYTCPHRKCKLYDQKKYCDHNVGLYGCQEEDGCFDNWCR